MSDPQDQTTEPQPNTSTVEPWLADALAAMDTAEGGEQEAKEPEGTGADGTTGEPEKTGGEGKETTAPDANAGGGDPEAVAAEGEDPEKSDGADPKAEEKEDPAVTRSFGALADAEAKFQSDRRAFKVEQASFRQEAQRLQRLEEAVRAHDHEIRTDPLGVLQKRYQISFDDLTKMALGDGKADPKAPAADEGLRKDIEALRSDVKTDREKREQAEQRERDEAMVTQYRSGVEAEMQGDRYELLRLYPRGIDGVMERAYELAAQGVHLKPAEFVERMHGEYVEQLKSSGLYEKAHRAVSAKAEETTETKPPKGGSSDGPRNGSRKAPTTLTNELAGTPPPQRKERPWHELSEEEQLVEVAALVAD